MILQGLGGGEGCPTFSRRVQPFPGGGGGNFPGGGVQIRILETHRPCDFPGGGANPLSPSPLDPRM